MSPDVLRSKVVLLQKVLSDLKPHVKATRKAQEDAHYEIERQVQLAVDLSAAAARRLHVLHGIPMPETSRQAFTSLGEAKLVSADLAHRLSLAAGLRNLLVHEYGDLDYDIFFGGLEVGYQALVEFSGVLVKELEAPPGALST